MCYQNLSVKFRNRTERFMVEYTTNLCKNLLDFTIEDLRTHLIQVKREYILKHKQHGDVYINEIKPTSCLVGSSNIIERCFAIYGNKRLTYTLSLHETLFKDKDDELNVAICVYNGNDKYLK